VSVSVHTTAPAVVTPGALQAAVNPFGNPEATLMLAPAAPLAAVTPPKPVAVTVNFAVAKLCMEAEAGDTANVIPGACCTCNVRLWLAVRPFPVAVTLMVALPTVAVAAAVSVNVSVLEFAPVAVVTEFACHAAVTPAGSPLTTKLTLPLNEPPVTAFKVAVQALPCTTAKVLAATVSVSVGGCVTVSAYVSVCVPVASDPVNVTVCAPAAAEAATATVTVTVDPGKIVAELKLTVTPAGALAASVTLFFAVPLSVTLTVNVAVLPVSTVPLALEALSAKSALATTAAPHSLTSNAPSTDPNPDARLNSLPFAVNPVTPGTLLFPEGVA